MTYDEGFHDESWRPSFLLRACFRVGHAALNNSLSGAARKTRARIATRVAPDGLGTIHDGQRAARWTRDERFTPLVCPDYSQSADIRLDALPRYPLFRRAARRIGLRLLHSPIHSSTSAVDGREKDRRVLDEERTLALEDFGECDAEQAPHMGILRLV